MSMTDLLFALNLVQENADEAEFAGPKSDELIALAESRLGLKFPPTYRTFLQQLGCGDIAGFEVYGLVGPNFESGSIPNGIWLTLNERNSSSLPSSLVLVAETGDGAFYAIDTGTSNSEGENPVVEWRSETSEFAAKPLIVANDFGAFFKTQLVTMLAD